MSDEYTDQQTRDVFAAARTEVLTYVRPAPAAELTRAVRRRHTGVAAAAVIAVAVGGAATVPHLLGDRRAAAPATPQASPSPTPSMNWDFKMSPPPRVPKEVAAANQRLATQAAAAIHLRDQNDNVQRLKDGKGAVHEYSIVPVNDRLGATVGGGGSGDPEQVDYVVEVACAGQGTIQIHFWAGSSEVALNPVANGVPSDATDLSLTCGDTPATRSAKIHGPYPDRIYHQIRPDAAATGHSGYAYLLRDLNRDGS